MLVLQNWLGRIEVVFVEPSAKALPKNNPNVCSCSRFTVAQEDQEQRHSLLTEYTDGFTVRFFSFFYLTVVAGFVCFANTQKSTTTSLASLISNYNDSDDELPTNSEPKTSVPSTAQPSQHAVSSPVVITAQRFYCLYNVF